MVYIYYFSGRDAQLIFPAVQKTKENTYGVLTEPATAAGEVIREKPLCSRPREKGLGQWATTYRNTGMWRSHVCYRICDAFVVLLYQTILTVINYVLLINTRVVFFLETQLFFPWYVYYLCTEQFTISMFILTQASSSFALQQLIIVLVCHFMLFLKTSHEYNTNLTRHILFPLTCSVQLSAYLHACHNFNCA